MKLASLLLLGTLFSVAAHAQTPTPPFTQCPAIGLNASCRILILIDKNGGQRVLTDPAASTTYDGSDDTLIGVVNLSANPVASIPLTSTTNIFGFDGDGICSSSITPHPAACPFGTTQYEGPGVSFASINPNGTAGVVNFSPAIAPNGGTAYFGLEAAIPTTCADADGDGLCDDWERNGLTVYVNGVAVFVDLPAMGADPNHKDVFIQADYMAGPGPCLPIIGCLFGHSHQPSNASIALVTQAFANAPVANPDGTTGVRLHVDCGPFCVMNPVSGALWGALSRSNVLTHQDALGTSAGGNYSWAAFEALKQTNFSTSRQQVFHYLILGHNLGGLDGTSGISRGITASDFIVTLGSWTNQIGTTMEMAGTLMHELGHNLSLLHGGNDSANYKPNYISVMNYLFQTGGIVVNGVPSLLDYSRFGLGNLNEASLNEPVGLAGGAPLNTFGTMYYCPGTGVTTLVANANGPIDWNCNGAATDATAAADINNDAAQTVLGTANNWPNIVYAGGAIGGLGLSVSQPLQTTVDPEISPAIDRTISKPLRVAVASPGAGNIIPGATLNVPFTITNTGIQSDTYALTANASLAWAQFTTVPAQVTLASGASTVITIPVTAPSGTALGTSATVTLQAISQANVAILDIGAATLTTANNTSVIASMVATAGGGGTAAANTVFSTPMKVTVTIPGSVATPVPGLNVTFTAPISGAGGTFQGGSSIATVVTDSNGVATAPTFTANGTAGAGYVVAVSSPGVGPITPILLTNTPAPAVSGPSGQTIDFPLVRDHSITEGAFPLLATASSGLPVSFRVIGGPATISGNVFTPTGIGRVFVEASQPGGAGVGPADPFVRNFVITPAAPIISAVVNAASNQASNFAPGSFNAIYGSNLGTTTVTVTTPVLPAQTGGVTLILTDAKGVATPVLLYYVSPSQINFYIPLGVAPGAGLLKFTNGASLTASVSVTVGAITPALFTIDGSGKGAAAAQVIPTTDRIYVVLYGTGIRNGKVVTVSIGGVSARLDYAGAQGQVTGLDQLNASLAIADFPSGAANVVLTVDGLAANVVTVAKP